MHTRKMAVLRLIFISLASYMFTCQADKGYEKMLIRYGYIKIANNSDRTEEMSPEKITEAMKKFQKFNGLIETGALDKPTIKLMQLSRCGNKDYGDDNMSSFTSVSAWDKKELTWGVNKFSRTSNLTTKTQLNILKKAFTHWSKFSGLSFTKIDDVNLADIKMSFEVREHGDNNPFDLKGNILGHAFYPNKGSFQGNVHFDDDEDWTENTKLGTNLEFVAVHELGHALGLAHSPNTKSVMAPFYRGFVENFALHSDDINGIQSLYGKPPITLPTTAITTIETSTHISENSTAAHQVMSLLMPVLSLNAYVNLMP